MKERPQRILRKPEVRRRTGLSDSSIYEKVRQGKFPPPIKIGPRASGWIESEIDEYIESLIRAARGGLAEDQ